MAGAVERLSDAGLEVARRAGRGDQARGIAVLALALASASFVSAFLPWVGFDGRNESGWSVPLVTDFGLLALAIVLLELLALLRSWTTRGSELLAFCLTAAAGVIGVSAVVNLRWGSLAEFGFSVFQYGAWITLALSILLLVLAALRLVVMWRALP